MRRAALATPRILPCWREKNVTTRSLSPRGNPPITTAAVLPRAMSGRQPEAELVQRAVVLAPRPPHLDPEAEEDVDAEERLQLLPRRHPDALERVAAASDEDPLLKVG